MGNFSFSGCCDDCAGQVTGLRVWARVYAKKSPEDAPSSPCGHASAWVGLGLMQSSGDKGATGGGLVVCCLEPLQAFLRVLCGQLFLHESGGRGGPRSVMRQPTVRLGEERRAVSITDERG